MAFKKLDTNIFERTWTTGDGQRRSALYFKLAVNGQRIAENAFDPDNPTEAPKTLKEARLFRDKLRVRLAAGLPPKGPINQAQPGSPVVAGETFAEFVERVYVPYSAANHRTHANYLDNLKILKAFFGEMPVDAISPFDVERFKAEQSRREKLPRYGGGKLAGNTIRLYLACLSNVFERAIDERVRPDNPCLSVAIPELIPKHKKRRLNREEETRLIEVARAHAMRSHLASGIIILLELGCREIELFRLTVDDVTWDAAPNDRTVRFVSYKSAKKRRATAQPRERFVPVTERAWAELLKLKAAATGDTLFPCQDVRTAWATTCRLAGVANFWFRWLRDEAASRWADAGMGPYEIAALLGHRDVKTSMIYVKPDRARLLSVMESANESGSKNVAEFKRKA